MLSNLEIARHLRSSKFLATASDATIEALSEVVETIPASAGQRLIDKGEIGTAMYFVVRGCVRVHNGEVVITHIGEGEVFGEVGALADQERTASVTAEMDSFLLKLEQEALYNTLYTRPDAAKTIIQALCQQEREIIRGGIELSVRVQVLENELEIGQRIQRNFLPDSIPEIPGWEMKGFLQPARKVAGDFYDFFIVPTPSCVGIVIGDVCDKGVGAALFMTLFRSLIRAAALYRNYVGDASLSADVVSTVRHGIALTNRYIASTHGSSSMFSSVFFGLLVPETGQLCYINAGHEAPLIVGASGIRERLETTGPVIGLFEDAEHEVGITKVLPGEVLVAYTDGVTDAKNPAGEQYSEERLMDLLARGPRNAGAVMHKILSEVEGHIGGADQYDDITVISVSRSQK